MNRQLRLARFGDENISLSANPPDADDVRELGRRLYEQRADRRLRPSRPQPALDWFLSLVFRAATDAAESEQPRLRRAA